VEGAHLRAACNDTGKHGTQVTKHVACRYSHDIESIASKERISRNITPWLITTAVRLAVDLDDKAMAEAREIGRHPIRWKLTAELQSIRPLFKRLPQQHFRQAHLPPQLTCALNLLD
jgi:hypothetical protein